MPNFARNLQGSVLKLYSGLSAFTPVPGVVSIGIFDGVHTGHRVLLRQMRTLAASKGLGTIVCSFDPHPRQALHGVAVPMLNTIQERIALLEASGTVDHLVLLPFTPELASMSARDFIRDVLIARLGMTYLVMGANNHIGSRRSGDVAHVREAAAELGFGLEVVEFDPSVPPVSSSAVRHALSHGEVDVAASLLGYPYALSGPVVEGNRLGRTIGFPTANIRVDDGSKLIPRQGVYAVRAYSGDSFFGGMLYIGARHVAGERDNPLNIEVHLFDFEGDLYGRELKVEFLRFLREPVPFGDVAVLRRQLESDALQARTWIK